MLSAHQIEAAMAFGETQADDVLAVRDSELRIRSSAAPAVPEPAAAVYMRGYLPSPYPGIVGEAVESRVDRFGVPGRATLLAEGDSWFDYPFADVLSLLEDKYAYDVDSFANLGDTIQSMAYRSGQLEKFARRIERLGRWGITPTAILLSGGGNDVAGQEFGMLLNHSRSPTAGVNESILTGLVEEQLGLAYVTFLRAVTRICQAKFKGRVIPILVHGYDYPIPDGRGIAGGWGPLPGPWLEPGFRQKGFLDIRSRVNAMKMVIDRFNEMLIEVTANREFVHVHHVDLRGTLSSGPDYRDDWANELHPSSGGFQKVTEKFSERISSLIP